VKLAQVEDGRQMLRLDLLRRGEVPHLGKIGQARLIAHFEDLLDLVESAKTNLPPGTNETVHNLGENKTGKIP
jgi:hypothetical protein